MSLEVGKLEKVRRLADGTIQARCPACAEGGQDRRGEHLRVFPDGRFGCCVHAKDREHRKRIFALAGEVKGRRCSAGSFQVKVAARVGVVQPAQSVKEALTGSASAAGVAGSGRGLDQRTALESGESAKSALPVIPAGPDPDIGTDGTANLNPRAYEKENKSTHMCKDTETGVLGVFREPKGEKLPYVTPDGTLVIPFDSPERYHWWKKGGQSVEQTLAEIRGPKAEDRIEQETERELFYGDAD